MKIILDAQQMKHAKQAHLYLKQKLGLPEYYGNNLDALYDCLGDMDKDTEIEIQNIGDNEKESYIARIVQVIQAAHISVVLND